MDRYKEKRGWLLLTSSPRANTFLEAEGTVYVPSQYDNFNSSLNGEIDATYGSRDSRRETKDGTEEHFDLRLGRLEEDRSE